MFQGFSPETFDFLWGIRLNNEKGWFEAHKQDYVNYLYEPMKALGQAVFQGFSHAPAMELKVSRIYRDARLHPPVPYKESLWLCIRRSVQEWTRHPTLYFEIRPEGASYGFVLYQPTATAMESFRQSLKANPKVFPELLKKAQAESGLTLSAQCYKRPKPCDDPALLPYYSWKWNLGAERFIEPGQELFTGELAETVQKQLLPWVPVCDYFYGVTLYLDALNNTKAQR